LSVKKLQQKPPTTTPKEQQQDGIPADTQHPQETGKHPEDIRPSTKNKKFGINKLDTLLS
ncbi:hypothetical protein, partial [Kocuria salsicia]|uniref:hypothetical protein n=1 Tax=Kocuria salsicia TaxID=664639 RepID=UPI001C92F4EC